MKPFLSVIASQAEREANESRHTAPLLQSLSHTHTHKHTHAQTCCFPMGRRCSMALFHCCNPRLMEEEQQHMSLPHTTTVAFIHTTRHNFNIFSSELCIHVILQAPSTVLTRRIRTYPLLTLHFTVKYTIFKKS